MNGNLYTDHTGVRTFSGVIDETKKGDLVLIDDFDEATIINSNVPVGIDMLLIRNMEAYLDIPFTHVKARRMR